ncbi:unnamed protein product, partial [Bubo scandiacus]
CASCPSSAASPPSASAPPRRLIAAPGRPPKPLRRGATASGEGAQEAPPSVP